VWWPARRFGEVPDPTAEPSGIDGVNAVYVEWMLRANPGRPGSVALSNSPPAHFAVPTATFVAPLTAFPARFPAVSVIEAKLVPSLSNYLCWSGGRGAWLGYSEVPVLSGAVAPGVPVHDAGSGIRRVITAGPTSGSTLEVDH
jgi:hypothetical protein